MKQTETLIVGASMAGMAVAAVLQKFGREYCIIEKQAAVGSPWRRHYKRLHLHTNKRVSHLPYKKFDGNIPRYPSRQEVIAYLEAYQQAFNIHPIFNTEVISTRHEAGHWISETEKESVKSKYLVMATGAFGQPRPVNFPGMDSFPGMIMHSCAYKTGEDFRGKRVLVVGFGNSAGEIAIDLFEQGAIPSLSVRSPVNIIPRDILGIPILEVSQFLSHLPPRLADRLSAPFIRLVLGDITKLGLRRKSIGPFQQIKQEGKIPVLDIGTIKHIRQRHIQVCAGIDRINGNTIRFTNETEAPFDAIIACIGYDRNVVNILEESEARIEDLKNRTSKQMYFGKQGLYFCGFWIAPTGQIREIALDAHKIGRDIMRRESGRRAG